MTVEFLTGSSDILAGCLAMWERHRTTTWLGHLVRGRLVRNRIFPNPRNQQTTRRVWLYGAIVLCLAAVMLLPWPHRISCHCEVQPVIRRFVVAPYDGTLESSQVLPGDVVHKGDMLARMDEREIRWELAGLEADYAHARKERDAAMAVHRTSAAQLAELEMEHLQVEMQLLEHRIDHLAIRSPIDGIVVAGDLDDVEGAPLTIGQTLFEVAPLDVMTVEINIPEQDVALVDTGMKTKVRFEAFPEQPISGAIERIYPQAELHDHESVFVAQFRQDNQDQRLRPGMNGWATIAGRTQPVGWILFHRPWHSARRWLGW